MNRIIYLLLFIFSSPSLIAQRQIVSQDIYHANPDKNVYMDYSKQRKLGAHGFYNEESGCTALFLLHTKSINGFLYDKDFALISHQIAPKEKSKYKRVLGVSSTGKDYFLYLADKRTREFRVVNVDFAKNTIQEHDLDFSTNKEKYVQSFSYNNVFYLITVGNYSSVLRIYSLKNGAVDEVHKFDFSEYQFGKMYTKTIFQTLERTNELSNLEYSIDKITNNIPNTLEITSEKIKLFHNDDKLVLTFDNENERTIVITINLATFKYEIKKYPQIMTGCPTKIAVKSNSSVYKNCLFQVSACTSCLHLTMTDLETGTILGSYSSDTEKGIDFRNGDLYKELLAKDGTVWTKQIESTKKFLNMLQKRSLGIALYAKDSLIELQVGAVHGTNNSRDVLNAAVNTIAIGGMGLAISFKDKYMYAGLIPAMEEIPRSHYSYNSVMMGYRTFTHLRDIYFNMLFDPKTFERKPGLVIDNVFDRMKENTALMDPYVNFINVFKAGDLFIFGYYDKKIDKYLMLGYKEFE